LSAASQKPSLRQPARRVWTAFLENVQQRLVSRDYSGKLRVAKGTDLSVYSQAQLNKVAWQLNDRPRKTLGFETPAERFNACVASTG